MKKNFFLCGIVGWCMEIIFTSIGCLLDNNQKLIGHTSLWMFPIYGSAVIIYPIYLRIRHLPMLLRGLFYGGGILVAEYLSGSLLRLIGCCPWDYSGTPYNIHGLIRLDYLPFWMLAGLLFEQILLYKGSEKNRTSP